jgi:hypothetical protein
VEDVLSCHPAVQVAAVVGEPGALKGELPGEASAFEPIEDARQVPWWIPGPLR